MSPPNSPRGPPRPARLRATRTAETRVPRGCWRPPGHWGAEACGVAPQVHPGVVRGGHARRQRPVSGAPVGVPAPWARGYLSHPFCSPWHFDKMGLECPPPPPRRSGREKQDHRMTTREKSPAPRNAPTFTHDGPQQQAATQPPALQASASEGLSPFLTVLVTPKLNFSLPRQPQWRTPEDIGQDEVRCPCPLQPCSVREASPYSAAPPLPSTPTPPLTRTPPQVLSLGVSES